MMDVQASWLGIAAPEVAPPDDSLQDGQVLSIGGIPGIILHTPGTLKAASASISRHTAFLLRETRSSPDQ